MHRNSLAFRLLASSAAWSILALVVVGIVLTSLFRVSVERAFDARLEDNLTALLASVEFRDGGLVETEVLGDARYRRPFDGWYWQVRPVDTATTAERRSQSLQDEWLPLPQDLLAQTTMDRESRFYMSGPFGRSLRVIEVKTRVPGSAALLSFAISGDSDELETQIDAFNRTVVIALSVLAAGLVAATFLQVRFGLVPLRRLTSELVAIRTGEADLLGEAYPDEIRPVAVELNALLTTNADVVERARTQVGNLAHALKTPLSVITNEADTHDDEFALKVAEQAGVMRDQIELYLDRARRAARAHALGSLTDVRTTLEGLVRTLDRINADRAITTELRCAADLRFLGEQQDLEEMVGNLLDNAYKWARARISIRVEAAALPADTGRARMVLVVEDDGPGLPQDRREIALQRGRRLDETKPGSGLGLSIVAETAAMYNGSIALDRSPRGGLKVMLTLPASPARTLPDE